MKLERGQFVRVIAPNHVLQPNKIYAVHSTSGDRIHLASQSGSYKVEDFELVPDAVPFQEEISGQAPIIMTLPVDSNARKEYPILSGFLKYFPSAIAGVAKVSKRGNDKHNPGEPLHHARWKSMDHGDCILRHLTDVEDLLAAQSRGISVHNDAILLEVDQMVWRALAYSQMLHESLGAPLAPAAKVGPK